MIVGTKKIGDGLHAVHTTGYEIVDQNTGVVLECRKGPEIIRMFLSYPAAMAFAKRMQDVSVAGFDRIQRKYAKED